jgi:hypothetical protein
MGIANCKGFKLADCDYYMSDAEVVVKCINSKVYVAAIVQDCRELLLTFQSTNVMLVKCEVYPLF